MSAVKCTDAPITQGYAARLIKNTWITEGKIASEAFDLRGGDPPELYVSHVLAPGNTESERFKVGLKNIRARMPTARGNLALLLIEEALSDVNDDEALICFLERGVPHCGLFFLTADSLKIVEVKSTLCFLAKKRVRKIAKDQLGPCTALLGTSEISD